MSDLTTTIDELRKLVEQFVAERQWHKFHTPKNLAMALAIESAELMEYFQWLTAEESQAVESQPDQMRAIGEELADVLAYTLAMANALGIDMSEALRDKMAKNAIKYPADQYRGRWSI